MNYCDGVHIIPSNENAQRVFFNYIAQFDNIILCGPSCGGKSYFVRRYAYFYPNDVFCHWQKEGIVNMLWSDNCADARYFPIVEEFEKNLLKRYSIDSDNKIFFELAGLTQGSRTRAFSAINQPTRKTLLIFLINDPKMHIHNLSNRHDHKLFADPQYIMRQFQTFKGTSLQEYKEYTRVVYATFEDFGEKEELIKFYKNDFMLYKR